MKHEKRFEINQTYYKYKNSETQLYLNLMFTSMYPIIFNEITNFN